MIPEHTLSNVLRTICHLSTKEITIHLELTKCKWIRSNRWKKSIKSTKPSNFPKWEKNLKRAILWRSYKETLTLIGTKSWIKRLILPIMCHWATVSRTNECNRSIKQHWILAISKFRILQASRNRGRLYKLNDYNLSLMWSVHYWKRCQPHGLTIHQSWIPCLHSNQHLQKTMKKRRSGRFPGNLCYRVSYPRLRTILRFHSQRKRTASKALRALRKYNDQQLQLQVTMSHESKN